MRELTVYGGPFDSEIIQAKVWESDEKVTVVESSVYEVINDMAFYVGLKLELT
jgi:hypothetical protein